MDVVARADCETRGFKVIRLYTCTRCGILGPPPSQTALDNAIEKGGDEDPGK